MDDIIRDLCQLRSQCLWIERQFQNSGHPARDLVRTRTMHLSEALQRGGISLLRSGELVAEVLEEISRVRVELAG